MIKHDESFSIETNNSMIIPSINSNFVNLSFFRCFNGYLFYFCQHSQTSHFLLKTILVYFLWIKLIISLIILSVSIKLLSSKILDNPLISISNPSQKWNQHKNTYNGKIVDAKLFCLNGLSACYTNWDSYKYNQQGILTQMVQNIEFSSLWYILGCNNFPLHITLKNCI